MADALELLELAEEVFDQVAPLVERGSGEARNFEKQCRLGFADKLELLCAEPVYAGID